MQHNVNEFIVVAPMNMGKAIEWAEPQLRSFLEVHFPLYKFRIEPYGPFAEEDQFAIIPILSRRPAPAEQAAADQLLLAQLDPMIVPEIKNILRSFDPIGVGLH